MAPYRIEAGERALVIDAIKSQLSFAPDVHSGRKKVLYGLVPPWTQARPVHQLTVVPFRVFYDVELETRTVIVNAIRRKPPGKKTEDIL